jgi:GTP-binding protein
MKILSAAFQTSAPKLEQAPPRLAEVPEIPLLGRSNVGKSSFINCVLGRKNLAKTSNTPGKTRLMNFYEVQLESHGRQETLRFVDFPGYGYAKVSKSAQAEWGRELSRFLEKRDAIRLCLQLIDGRHGPQENDHQMFEWLTRREMPLLIILTKLDKINQKQRNETLRMTSDLLEINPDRILPFSSETGLGRDAFWTKLNTLLWAPSVAVSHSAEPTTTTETS